MRHNFLLVAFLLVVLVPLGVDRPSCAAEIDFQRDIKPLLTKYCVSCHGATKQEGGLRLDVQKLGLKGGDNYQPAIKPGASVSSPLYQFIADDKADLRMPPKGPRLSAAEISLFKQWIDAGAKWPEDTEVAETRGSKHWSFQPLRQEPRSTDGAPSNRPVNVDHFITTKLQAAGLAMSPRADRRALIRRLYLVMHGLPPTPEQVDVFVNDQSSDAWPKLVEQVLAGPRYGERWAQHWLDLVRFGETNGYETNRERNTAWHYRDYVIDAFHRDKPYDVFIREQIAGDAFGNDVGTGFLVAGPVDIVKSQDINLTLMQRQDELADILNTTGTAFLGLTIGCARCHNHKFDPVTQKDYYALQAIFAGVQHGERALPMPADHAAQVAQLDARITELTNQLAAFIPKTESAPGQLREAVNAKLNVERFAPVAAKRVRFTITATNSAQPCLDELAVFVEAKNVALASAGTKARASSTLPGYDIHKLAHINDGQYGNAHSWISNEGSKGWIELEFPQVEQIDRIEWGRDRDGQFKDRVATSYRIEVSVDEAKWKTVATSEDRQPFSGKSEKPDLPMYRFDDATPERARQGRDWLAELNSAKQRRTQLTSSLNAYVGRFQQPGATHRLFRGEPQQPREEVGPNTIALLGDLQLAANAPEKERRVKFAEWLSRADNPLTARVWVNRLWQFQFGRGLVDTPNDFGANGVPPTHPELLDWLAQELIASKWSTKHVQRLILLSRTWQQDSRPNARGLDVDAGSSLLWRFPPRRLEAEAIRDSILMATGVLDLKAGGPGFDGFEVQLENVRHYFPKKTFGPNDWRRMIYMTKVRMEKESTFGIFDCPDASQVVARRSLSTTPLQALNLLNSEFIQQQAKIFAERLQKEAGNETYQQVRRAYSLCFLRAASNDELDDASKFIAAHGLEQFSRAILNANELLFVP